MFTFCLDVAYNPNANVALIEHFLTSLGLNDHMIDYLQEAAGYTLTGDTAEECMFYIQGPPRSGKGTFTNALRRLLKEPLSAEISINTLATSKHDSDKQNFALAPLRPCRMVIASESGKYSKLTTHKIKQITGGDSIHCAFKGKDFFNYRPQFKIWITSNNPPRPDDVEDDAFWDSRLKLIIFPISFVGREDKGLKARRVSRHRVSRSPAYLVRNRLPTMAQQCKRIGNARRSQGTH